MGLNTKIKHKPMGAKMFKHRTPTEMMAKAKPGENLVKKLKPHSKSEERRLKAQTAGKKNTVVERFDAYR